MKNSPPPTTEPSHNINHAIELILKEYLNNLNGNNPCNLHEVVVSHIEKQLIKTIMEHVDANQTIAAKILGISRSTLRAKIKKHNILPS